MVRLVFLLSMSIVTLVAPPVHPGEHAVNGRHFTLPDGFELQLIAAPPLVDRPICADFDQQGRLYVAESSGSNDKVQKQLQEKPHRILRLEDTDGDGRFDTRVVFAEKMMFPEGALWYDGSLYVAAPPSIWKLTDTNGDGVADRREEWFQGKTLTGCANDLHGPYLGPDGWIYWCKGAFAKQTYQRAGKQPFVTRAAHIFRRHPAGQTIEPVMTGGMDNPVEVVFTPGGERIFTTTFLQHPGGGRRDGLIHAIYGGVYGKLHDVIQDHPRTGDVMPVLTHLGAAAPCGLARLESDQLGAEYENNLVACLFNMHKLTRHVLQPAGATFTSRDEDFLVCDDIDFHPTDVIEDADGSLVVIDTGGWYKLCCPTSQLRKPDLLGAIYRVRRVGRHGGNDPRGLTLDWSGASSQQLARRLGDSRPAVRRRAAHVLAGRGAKAVAVLRQTASDAGDMRARLNAVWTLTRITGNEAREAVRITLSDSDPQVRQAAIHSVSIWRDRPALPRLIELLEDGSLHNRRVAAEALGRIGDHAAVAALLAAASEWQDRVLEHALTFALIETADPVGTREGMRATSPYSQRAALIALDQMEGGVLSPQDIEELLVSSHPVLRETAAWIVDRHPEWGPDLLGFFHGRLTARDLSVSDLDQLAKQLVRFSHDPDVQELMASGLRDELVSPDAKRAILRAMARCRPKTMPPTWAAPLERLLRDPDEQLVATAVSTVRSLPAPASGGKQLTDRLLEVARQKTLPDELRVEALAAITAGMTEVEADFFELLCAHLPADRSVRTRSFAVDVLSRATLTAPQLGELIDSLDAVGPLELNRLLTVFERCGDEQIGLDLLRGLERCPAAAALPLEEIKTRFAKFGDAVRQQAEHLHAKLHVDAEQQRSNLDGLAASLVKGDVRRGQLVFNSPKAACAACHAIGYLGGSMGPDLTRIGRIRSERDLLEAIVYPSASFVRSYEPMVIVTTQGQIFSGVLRNSAEDEVLLGIDAEKEVRIAREDIEEMQPGKVSTMPAALDKQLTIQQLSDLVAFLKASQ